MMNLNVAPVAPVATVAAPAAPGTLNMGIPTGAMPMGIPTGAMPMGIPTGTMPKGIPTGAFPMGIPTGALPMGIPNGAKPMGIPTGAMPKGNRKSKAHKKMRYADVKDNGLSLSGSYGGFSGGIKMDDNSTVCDSKGNCMVTDKLFLNMIDNYAHNLVYARKDREKEQRMSRERSMR
jgi:hypothetical protein